LHQCNQQAKDLKKLAKAIKQIRFIKIDFKLFQISCLIQNNETILRSHRWFYGANETGLLHKGALRAAGIDMDGYNGQPVIGIANTWGELNNCNMSLRAVAEEVKKGIRKQVAFRWSFR
jgi:dihydroxyacid dehydratase/phosphogluconate dehydratase